MCYTIQLIYFVVFIFYTGAVVAEQGKSPSVKIIKTAPDKLLQGCFENMFEFENFPKNVTFNLLLSRVFQKEPLSYKLVEQLQIDDSNLFIIKGKKYQNYAFTTQGTAFGERFSYRFQLKNGEILAETSFIPKPIQMKSRDGTFSVEAELVLYLPTTAYLLHYAGLEEEEVVHLTSISGEELIESNQKFRPQDKYLYAPQVIGLKGGKSYVDISRVNGDRVCFTLPWGTNIIYEALKKLYSHTLK